MTLTSTRTWFVPVRKTGGCCWVAGAWGVAGVCGGGACAGGGGRGLGCGWCLRGRRLRGGRRRGLRRLLRREHRRGRDEAEECERTAAYHVHLPLPTMPD